MPFGNASNMGDTLEISVPYLLPDSTLLSLFLTQRGDRYIVCDGGGIMEILSEYCPLPLDETMISLQSIARKFGVKEGESEGAPLFFKECLDPKLISSLAFDIANFVSMATSSLVSASSDDLGVEPASRFQARADILALSQTFVFGDYDKRRKFRGAGF
jgi:hypothetical protein